MYNVIIISDVSDYRQGIGYLPCLKPYSHTTYVYMLFNII